MPTFRVSADHLVAFPFGAWDAHHTPTHRTLVLDFFRLSRFILITQHMSSVISGPADLVVIVGLAFDSLASESQLQLPSAALLATRLLLERFLRHV